MARQVASPSRDDSRSLDCGQVLVEHPPHQLAHRGRPVPLVHQIENLQVARARPLQRIRRVGAGAVAQVIDVLRTFDERIGAASAEEIDVEDHVLGKIELRPPGRAFGLLIDRRKRHAQLADVLDRQEGAAQARPGRAGGARARIDLERRPGRHPVSLHQRQQAPQTVGRIGVVGVEAGDDVGARLARGDVARERRAGPRSRRSAERHLVAGAQVGRQDRRVVEVVVGAQHQLHRHALLRKHRLHGPADGGRRPIGRHDDADVGAHRLTLRRVAGG